MGMIFKAPAIAIYVIGGLWGMWVCLSLVYQVGGLLLSAIALVLAPAFLYLAPWYAAFFRGDWFPVMLVYGTTVVAGLTYAVGEAVDGRTK